MTAVRITLLGGFAAEVDGEAVAAGAWRLRKARELVKMLALADGHRLHRERLLDALWPEQDPTAAANNLHQAVHAARRALLPAAIEVHDGLVRLRADVDVDAFERAAAHARRSGGTDALRRARLLYAGELLPENLYDDWAADRRRSLEREAADVEAALDAVAGALPPLPAETSSFVGRARELAEVSALLARTRLLTLAGVGGAGKTRLALELARRSAGAYRDGVGLAELASLDHARGVAAAVAAVVDVRALPGQDPADAAAEALGPLSVLLVLDNCEHVVDGVARTVARLLAAAPGLTVVATSREPLRLPAEVVFRVPSLALPAPVPDGLEALLRSEAVQLFAARAAAADPHFRVDAANAAAVAAICVRLDGLPLALELAAARVGALGPEAIAARLDDRFRLLRDGSRSAPTRQQTLEATLRWSHDLLADDERALFRHAAVFADGFDLAAAEAVHGGPGTATTLARLVEKSLVTADDTPQPRRYRLLETVRLYARERLVEAGELHELGLRHAAWALAAAEAATDPVELDAEGANLGVALDTLLAADGTRALRLCLALWPSWLRRLDLGEARRRFEHALAAAPEPTPLRGEALLAAAVIDFRAGDLERVLALAEEALALASRLGGRRLEWQALQTLGELGVASDRLRRSTEAFEAALALARREGFAPEVALGVYSLGACRWFAGDAEGAEELFAESAALFAAADGPTRSPLTLTEFRSLEGGRPGLRVAFEDTLQPFVPTTCAAAAGHVAAARAAVARVQGDPVRSRQLLDRAAEVFERLDDPRGASQVLVRRAHLELDAGATASARRCLLRGLELRRRVGDRRGVGMVLAGLGHLETVAGRYRAAERRLAEACELFRRAGDRWGLSSALWRVADLAVARGRLDDASRALADALEIVRPTARQRWLAHTLARLGEVRLLAGDREKAVALLQEAQAVYADYDDPVGADAVAARLAKVTQSRRKEARSTSSPGHPRTGRER